MYEAENTFTVSVTIVYMLEPAERGYSIGSNTNRHAVRVVEELKKHPTIVDDSRRTFMVFMHLITKAFVVASTLNIRPIHPSLRIDVNIGSYRHVVL